MWSHSPHHTYASCGEILDLSTSFIWRYLKILPMWRNIRFLHIYHAKKSEIFPHDKFFSTHLITDISDKYQVWVYAMQCNAGSLNLLSSVSSSFIIFRNLCGLRPVSSSVRYVQKGQLQFCQVSHFIFLFPKISAELSKIQQNTVLQYIWAKYSTIHPFRVSALFWTIKSQL